MRAFNASQNRAAVGAADVREGWLWWVHQHEKRFEEMIMAGLPIMQVWPERMVEGDFRQVQEMISWLGLEWRDKEVKEFIEPKLWKAKQKMR